MNLRNNFLKTEDIEKNIKVYTAPALYLNKLYFLSNHIRKVLKIKVLDMF
jgi:hypothetical protein